MKYVVYTEETIRKGFVVEADSREAAIVEFERQEKDGTAYESEDADYFQESPTVITDAELV